MPSSIAVVDATSEVKCERRAAGTVVAAMHTELIGAEIDTAGDGR